MGSPLPSFDRSFAHPLALLRLLSLLALLVFLAGCSNDPYPPGESAGNVRYVIWYEEIKSLDPTVAYDIPASEVIDNIYSCFYKYDHLRTEPYVLDPDLGAAEPTRAAVTLTDTDPKTGKTVSLPGEQWTFRIKRGIRFQDDPCFPGGKGREVTAADFVYSWRRLADPHLNCQVLSFVQDKVQGLDALIRHNQALAKQHLPADYAFPLPGVETVPGDPYTFRIRLIKPYPQLRYLMAMHFTTPIPHEAIEKYGDDFSRHPVGCGTFMLGEYRPHQRITLVRNPNRTDDRYPTVGDPGDKEAGLLRDAGKPLPLLDKIVFVWTKETVTAWNLFEQGYLDSYGVTPDNYNQVLQSSSRLSPEMVRRGVRMRRVSTPGTWYFVFNMKDPVWGGSSERARKIRQAVSLCIDRQQFIDVMTQGLGKPADFMLPPGIPGYDPDYRNPYCRHDVAEAKRLLAEAGYPDGVDSRTGQRLTLPIDFIEGGSAEQQNARLLKQWIEESGIHVDLGIWQEVAWQDRVLSGKFTFVRYSWFADYPDPENFLQLLYGPSTGVNYAQYNNPAYNRLYEQMRGMTDGPARMAIIRQMRGIAQDECCWIPFYYPEGIAIAYPWLRNDKPNGMSNDAIRYTAINGAQRAAFLAANNRPNYWPLLAVAAVFLAAIIPAGATVNARRARSVRRPERAVVIEPAEPADAEALASEKKAGV